MESDLAGPARWHQGRELAQVVKGLEHDPGCPVSIERHSLSPLHGGETVTAVDGEAARAPTGT